MVLQLLSKKESRRAAAEMFTHATLLNKIPLERFALFLLYILRPSRFH